MIRFVSGLCNGRLLFSDVLAWRVAAQPDWLGAMVCCGAEVRQTFLKLGACNVACSNSRVNVQRAVVHSMSI